ncbi:hypothetical protein [Streptomyces sp. NPDC093093]|uniref:hypothetical protein n=1 Tax=Streptomyces sp. NPDC093093 TaxID=3366025 RepID=UPI003809AEF0
MKSLQAPAVARRADRLLQRPRVIVDPDGVRYGGSKRTDQLDPYFGVVWEGWGGPVTGAPQYGQLDPEVQREALDRLQCGHCLGEPDRAPGAGVLWLLAAEEITPAWPADIRTTNPPICLAHAELALERCAVLRSGYLAVRARRAVPVGVLGSVYTLGVPTPVGVEDQLVLFTDTARLRFTIGRYLVLELRGATPDTTIHP